MASSISGLNKLISSNLLSKSLFRPTVVRSAAPIFTVRSFGEVDEDSSDDENDGSTLCGRFGLGRDGFFSDVMSIPSSYSRCYPTTRETGEALHIRLEMPGLSKEDVKVTVEENTLVIKGAAEKGSDKQVVSGMYESKLDLTENLFKVKEVKAEMKNGVLNLVVPKVVVEARADVINVMVD